MDLGIDTEKASVGTFYGNVECHLCGYCKNERGSKAYGMTMNQLSVEDYQDLVDRGWRRSGTYLYKPIMHETCCPLYTIKCEALNVILSKSQKKIIKKFNKYLGDGVLNKEDIPLEAQSSDFARNSSDTFMREAPHVFNIKEMKMISKSKVPRIEIPGGQRMDDQGDGQVTTAFISPSNNNKSCGDVPPVKDPKKPEKIKSGTREGLGADPTKPPPKKAKLLRLERKQAKLLNQGVTFDKTKVQPNVQKSLEQFLEEIPKNVKHKLKIKLTRSTAAKAESAKLYAKYQLKIHDDDIEECDYKSFKSFLVTTPLKYVPFSNGVDGPGYGSFHQQYWLDDKLIAVGVIDILPKCVSSVYFFYDPDYRNLTLGTYGSLREIEFTRRLHQLVPSIESYYMGYYIHSCPKMRYKGKLTPSSLLCPETYHWIPIERCLPKLDVSKYSRLNDDVNAVDENRCTNADVDKINMFYKNRIMKYQYFKQHYQRTNQEEDQEVFENMAQYIGRKCLKNFILYVYM